MANNYQSLVGKADARIWCRFFGTLFKVFPKVLHPHARYRDLEIAVTKFDTDTHIPLSHGWRRYRPLFCVKDVCGGTEISNGMQSSTWPYGRGGWDETSHPYHKRNPADAFHQLVRSILPKSEISQQRYGKTEYFLRKHTAYNQLIS